jgi:predicted dinucleotide-binding enzyme
VDLVVLATKSNAALDTARELADAIGDTPVLSVASDVAFTDRGVLPGRGERSLAEELAGIVGGPVASGLQSLSAAHLAAATLPDEDALVCGDDPRAKQLALELAEQLVAGRAVDVGPLANSRALEAMTAAILNVNRGYGITAGLRLTGFP